MVDIQTPRITAPAPRIPGLAAALWTTTKLRAGQARWTLAHRAFRTAGELGAVRSRDAMELDTLTRLRARAVEAVTRWETLGLVTNVVITAITASTRASVLVAPPMMLTVTSYQWVMARAL